MLFVSDISLHKYCLEGLVTAVYQNGRDDLRCPDEAMYCHYSNSEIIMKELGMEDAGYYSNVFKILAQLMLFKYLSYFTLRRRLLKG